MDGVLLFPDLPSEPWPMPKKKLLTEADPIALIVKEAKYRIGCENFTPTFSLRRAEPDGPGHFPRANWDATPEGIESWPRDCAEAFREAVTRNRGKYDLDWPR